MEKQLLRISDLNMASALLCEGLDIIGIDDRDPKKFFFFFDRTPASEEMVKKYWNGLLRVDPKLMGSYRREILTRINQDARI
ncbi:MAG: hypothetical protein BWY21_01970 [Parcubacteria group bacterium ADurb.Bin216]|jgi:hypothetical protein|nr:MAG: hypothetical protein BWY21_01970 [Parcubacteria group bacterium ADurb.Bin216]